MPLDSEEPLRRDADGENGRLCVRGQHQLIFGPFETETAQRSPKRRVRFVEQLAADRKGFGERLPHADFLRTLAGKDERDHWFRPTAAAAISRSTRSMKRSDANRNAIATALRTALALERPWPTMAIPAMPSSGAPPYSE